MEAPKVSSPASAPESGVRRVNFGGKAAARPRPPCPSARWTLAFSKI